MKAELGESDEVNGISGYEKLYLSLDTVNALKEPSPKLPYGESEAIQTLYHEATHAYLVSQKEDLAVKKLMESGKRYYTNAPLKYGETADDPERLFHEAAASYVGHRAATWWNTLESIVYVERVIRGRTKGSRRTALQWAQNKLLYRIDILINQAKGIPQKYNDAMRQLTFGYEDELRGLSFVQIETTKRMPDVLKQFCDHVILEGKMPDQFMRASFLVKKHNEVLKLIAPLTLPVGIKHGGGRKPGKIN
jgi:hypothetical protein